VSGKLHKQTAAFFIQTQDGKCSGFVFDSVLLFPFPFPITMGHAGTVKYYAQIHLQVWQNSVCTGQGNLPLIT